MRYDLVIDPSPGPFKILRLRSAVLVLGLCAVACLTQRPALGQSQLGAAETCFDQEPGFSPAVHATPAPIQMGNALNGRLAELVSMFRMEPVKSQPAKTAPAPREDARAKSRLVAELKNSEGPLTRLR